MIICFSRIVDYKAKNKYPSNIPLGGADDNFNRRIIDGLEENGEEPILINYMPYHSYPSGRFMKYKREETECRGRITINCGYLNIPVLKAMSLKKNLMKETIRVISETDHKGKICIIIYDLYDAFLTAALELKRKYSNIKTVLIVPSIPTVDVPRLGIRAKINKIFACFAVKKAKRMDSFIFLTKYMNDILNKNGKPFVVIEGIAPDINKEVVGEFPNRLINEKYVLYSGRLDRIYGIDLLVECFLKNKMKDLKLVLCGVGDCEHIIEEVANTTDKIIYLGFLNRPELNAVQRKAFFLINTRTADGEYTRYSFPSKIMEYLVSGKPSLMFKLPGIPDEYDKYLNYIDNNSVEGIKDAILQLNEDINNGVAVEKAMNGFYFVTREKSPGNQSKKIIQLLRLL